MTVWWGFRIKLPDHAAKAVLVMETHLCQEAMVEVSLGQQEVVLEGS